MDVSLLLKIAGVGILISVVTIILGKSGRDEQATLLSIAGIVVVLLVLIAKIGELFASLREVFGL